MPERIDQQQPAAVDLDPPLALILINLGRGVWLFPS
jgi:hypothetical protein